MMKDMINCDICYPKQVLQNASPPRKRKEIAKSPDRNATCNFSSQYDAGRDTRRRHRRQYEVKQLTCEKCRHPTASSSEDINLIKSRFLRRSKKPEMEDKGIGYSWSKRSFINMRNFLHRPCKWCKDYKDTSSQCGSSKKEKKPFTSIQTRTLTVMTDKKMTRDKSALMNLPTIKEDCAVQTRSRGIAKPVRLKSYDTKSSAVGPSHGGDSTVHKGRTKKSIKNRKTPHNDAAVEKANIGDNAVVDIYNRDAPSSDDTEEQKRDRRRDAKIANKRCGIWNIQFLTQAKNYPAIRLEISPRQTINKLGEFVPKISRETAKENIISWFDYKSHHSKANLRSKKKVDYVKRKKEATTHANGNRNVVVNHCAISDTCNKGTTKIDASDSTELDSSRTAIQTPSEYIYDIHIPDSNESIQEEKKNLYRDGKSFQTKVDVYHLYTSHVQHSITTDNELTDVDSITSVNAEEIHTDTRTLYDSLLLLNIDRDNSPQGKCGIASDILTNIIHAETISSVSVNSMGSKTFIIQSARSEVSNNDDILQSQHIKKAVFDLYSQSDISDTYNSLKGFSCFSSEKRTKDSINKNLK